MTGLTLGTAFVVGCPNKTPEKGEQEQVSIEVLDAIEAMNLALKECLALEHQLMNEPTMENARQANHATMRATRLYLMTSQDMNDAKRIENGISVGSGIDSIRWRIASLQPRNPHLDHYNFLCWNRSRLVQLSMRGKYQQLFNLCLAGIEQAKQKRGTIKAGLEANETGESKKYPKLRFETAPVTDQEILEWHKLSFLLDKKMLDGEIEEYEKILRVLEAKVPKKEANFAPQNAP